MSLSSHTKNYARGGHGTEAGRQAGREGERAINAHQHKGNERHPHVNPPRLTWAKTTVTTIPKLAL